MWTVSDQLYLGTETDALDHSVLDTAGITHVVNCAREIACPSAEGLSYLHLQLADPDPAFHSCIDNACLFIQRGCGAGAVFVHCKGAVSRSPSVILAYLCHCGFSLLDAAAHLGGIVATRPNDIFIRQIADHFDTPLDEDALGKVYELLARNASAAQQ